MTTTDDQPVCACPDGATRHADDCDWRYAADLADALHDAGLCGGRAMKCPTCEQIAAEAGRSGISG